MPGTEPYKPDYRLQDAYLEASQLDAGGLEAVCPSYLEVATPAPRYEGETLIGRGATKEVFRAFDTRMKRWVAVARLRPDCGPDIYDQFIHEAWLTSSLAHPNIIGIHDLGVDEQGRPFFTMDLKGETSLADLIAATATPPLTEQLGILVKICDAIAYAHAHRILHLDLKPENVQVDRFGEVRVCDWGLGLVIRGGDPADGSAPAPDGVPLNERHDTHSLTGAIRGTPGYMAPEQATEGAQADERTDVFALGCLLHALLTGESPVPEGDLAEQLERTRVAGFPSPRRRFPGRLIPAALEAVFHKATARDPQHRYDSVIDLRAELTRHLAGYATDAEQAGFLTEAGLFLRRNRVAAAISLLGVVVLTVLSVLFIQRLDQQRQLTAAEHRKSTALEGDVNRLEDLNAAQTAEFRESARKLALSFARSADSLKNIGIFNEPVKSIEEASQLAAMALTLDPECDAARLQQFDLHCHILDFKAALAAPRISKDNPFADYLEIVALEPEFAFNGQSRPTSTQLAGFLRKAGARNPNRAPLMERIVCYDVAARRDYAGYQQVVSALLAYANPGWDEAGFRYEPVKRALELRASGSMRLVALPGGGSGGCLLRFLPVRSLTLAIDGPVNLSGLELATAVSLDLRDCPQARLDKEVRLPLLRTVRVARGKFDRSRLSQMILTAAPLEVIEES